MKWALSMLTMVSLTVPVGCGDDGSGTARSVVPETTASIPRSAVADDKPRFRQGPRGYPVAPAPDAATAQRWCDEAGKGTYRAALLQGESQVQFVLPRRGDRRFICPLPAGRQRFEKRARGMRRSQEQLDELFERHERHGKNEF